MYTYNIRYIYSGYDIYILIYIIYNIIYIYIYIYDILTKYIQFFRIREK